MNLMFLRSANRVNKGWRASKSETVPDSQFKFWKLSRPSEDVLDDFYQELTDIWNGILIAVPELRNQPATMRNHNPIDGEDANDGYDHVVFWPIGQELFSRVVRELLDEHSSRTQKETLNAQEVVEALEPLKRVKWSLHVEPWRHLLLVQTPRGGGLTWTMRNEGRTDAIRIGREVLEFIVGITQLDEQGEKDLRGRWTDNLVPVPSEEAAEKMWQGIIEQATSD